MFYINIFTFSIIFVKHLKFVKKNGHPNPNACCTCVDGGCCDAPPNQPVIYQQPGVALQVSAASPAKDGVPTIGKQAAGQVIVMQQNVNGANDMDPVSRAMLTNGGYCWKVTLISLTNPNAKCLFLSGIC